MTEKEFYEDLVQKTKNKDIRPIPEVKDLSRLLRLLIISQLTEENLKELEFFSNEKPIKEFLRDYNPTLIRRVGSYSVLLDEALMTFGDEKKSLIKKLCQAASQSARYLSHYQNIQDYKKKLYLVCLDEETTFQFLQEFRKTSSLASMYFLKTCSLFFRSGLLDVPEITPEMKEKLIASFGLPDDNKAIYQKMIRIARNNHVSVAELTLRLEAE